MAPSAVDPPARESGPPDTTHPLKLYSVKESHFEKFLEPQPDGYQKAAARGRGNAAIVIDNGNPTTLHARVFLDR
jgi:actin-related protein 5